MKPIQLKHPVNPTSAKFTLLVESMQRDGWVGRPVLVYEASDDMAGDYLQALTGSYRIAAARKLGIDPEVLVIADEPLTDSAREIAELFVGDDTRGINHISELLSLAARHHTDEVMVRMLKSLFGVDHPATRLLAQEVEEEEEEEERREEEEGEGVLASASTVPAKAEPAELEDLEEEICRVYGICGAYPPAAGSSDSSSGTLMAICVRSRRVVRRWWCRRHSSGVWLACT